MDGTSIHLFKLFGIPIRIHISWLIIFALITWSLAAGYFPYQYHDWPRYLYWVVGLITSLFFFLSVLLHEFAHSLVAMARGMKVRDIVLFVFGGVSEIGEEPPTAATEFLMTLVGPLTSFVLAVICIAISWVTRTISQPISAGAYYLATINLLLGIFNLVPGFPLDGGRLFRAIVWGITHDLDKATRWAVHVGLAIAWLMIIGGVLMLVRGMAGGLWWALIGWFLKSAAQGTYDRTRLKRALQGVPVRQIMSTTCELVSPATPIGSVIQDQILTRGIRCLPVSRDGQLLGIMTVHNAREVPRDNWETTNVQDVMVPMEKVKSISPDADLWAAIEEMTEEGVNQLPVMEDGHVIGMLGRDAVMTYLRMRAEMGI